MCVNTQRYTLYSTTVHFWTTLFITGNKQSYIQCAIIVATIWGLCVMNVDEQATSVRSVCIPHQFCYYFTVVHPCLVSLLFYVIPMLHTFKFYLLTYTSKQKFQGVVGCIANRTCLPLFLVKIFLHLSA